MRDSISAIPSGRGGTNIAHHDNLTIILDNPAGLAFLSERRRFDFSVDVLFTRLDYSDPHNDIHNKFAPIPLPQFGFSERTPNDRLTFGIGVFAPAGFAASYEQRHLLYGRQEYNSFGALLKILPAAAIRLSDKWSVGATFGLGISHAQLKMPYNLQTGTFRGMPTLVDMQASGVTPIWSLGTQYKLNEQTTFGLSFLAESRFRLKGDAHADMSGVGFPVLNAEYDAEADLVWPGSLGAGVTHWLNPRHRVSADVLWFDWSHAFDKLDLKLTNGSNRLFDLALGRKVHDTIPLDWRDALAFRTGYEFLVTPKDELRIGYIFHRSPIPSDTLIPGLGGTLEHALTLGYGHQWDKWRLDVAYQYSWGPDRNVGHSRLVGGDFDSSSFEPQAHWVFLTLSCGFDQ